MLLYLGSPVRCRDGVLGELADMVMLPAERRVTHLVVEPRHHRSEPRMLPIDLVASGSPEEAGAISLDCSIAEAEALPVIRVYTYARPGDTFPLQTDDWDIGIEDVLTVPTPGYTFEVGVSDDDGRVPVSYDRIPRGAVELRHTSLVTDADGERAGRLEGVIAEAGGSITHLALERGHLWGRRQVAVPSAAVATLAMDAVTLALTGAELDALATLDPDGLPVIQNGLPCS